MLYFAKGASPPPPSFTTTIKTHSTAMACSFPCRSRKFTFVLAHFADGAHLCCFARCANPMKCRLWLGMFCHECVLLFPCCARHALPRLLRFYMPTNVFFAYPCCIFAFPAAGRKSRRRLRFITFLAFLFVSVFLSRCAPVHFFTSPKPQQQCTAYFFSLLKRCCRERSVHKQQVLFAVALGLLPVCGRA